MAKPSRFRPRYEDYGVPRDRVEQDYPEFLKFGLRGTAEGVGGHVRDQLEQFGFRLSPRSGWAAVGKEVQIVELTMTGMIPESKGHSQLAKECRALSRKIDKIAFDVSRISSWQAITVAGMVTHENCADHVSSFFKTARSLDTIATYLSTNPQSAKWVATANREARLVLACKLAPFFEKEFGRGAKPRGGSEVRPIEEENDWTKFFQVVASFMFDGMETPDRQSILWEAARPSEIVA